MLEKRADVNIKAMNITARDSLLFTNLTYRDIIREIALKDGLRILPRTRDLMIDVGRERIRVKELMKTPNMEMIIIANNRNVVGGKLP